MRRKQPTYHGDLRPKPMTAPKQPDEQPNETDRQAGAKLMDKMGLSRDVAGYVEYLEEDIAPAFAAYRAEVTREARREMRERAAQIADSLRARSAEAYDILLAIRALPDDPPKEKA